MGVDAGREQNRLALRSDYTMIASDSAHAVKQQRRAAWQRHMRGSRKLRASRCAFAHPARHRN